MTETRFRTIRSGVFLVAIGSGSLARADTHDPTAAEALFLAGRDAVQRGSYDVACPKFAESERLDPAAGTLINLADCEEHVGSVAHAWEHWREAVDMLAPGDPRLPAVKQRGVAIEKRVPHLTVRVGPGAPEGTTVTRDGIEVGVAALSLPLPADPGEHTVIAAAPGHRPASFKVTLVEGQTQEVVVSPGEAEAPVEKPAPPVVLTPLPPPVVAEGPPASPRESHGTRTLGFVLAGAGVASIGVGAVTGLLAIGDKNDLAKECYPAKVCSPAGADAASSGQTMATVSTVTFAVGLAAAAAGVYFVLSSPHAAGHRTALSPLAVPGGGGALLTRSF